MCRKCHLSSIETSKQYVILVMCHWSMWRHLNKPFTLCMKMEHFSKQSECYHISAPLKLWDDTLKIYSISVQVVGSKASSHATTRWHDLFCSKDKDNKKKLTPPTYSKTASNKEKSVCSCRKCEGRPTYMQIWEAFSRLALSLSAVCKIHHGNRHTTKLAARWILHRLTDFQRASWVDVATYLFNLSEPNGPKRLTSVVIWNETWIYFFMALPANVGMLLAPPWRSEATGLQARFPKQDETILNIFQSQRACWSRCFAWEKHNHWYLQHWCSFTKSCPGEGKSASNHWYPQHPHLPQ